MEKNRYPDDAKIITAEPLDSSVLKESIDVNEFKYRQKPVIVEAFQWIHVATKRPKWFKEALQSGEARLEPMKTIQGEDDFVAVAIETPEGRIYAAPPRKDWIIKDKNGQLSILGPDEFKEAYEKMLPQYAFVPPAMPFECYGPQDAPSKASPQPTPEDTEAK